MKKMLFAIAVIMILAMSFTAVAKKEKCTTIQNGVLEYSATHYLAGQPLMVGFDPYGYNYQAKMFKGSYANAYLGAAGYPPYLGDDDAYLAENPGAEAHWAWPYRDVELLMKWDDAWLSNKDYDDDGMLDRHYGYETYIGSGAWITNHMWGEEDGMKWNYFTKIVAVPEDAYQDGGIWYTAEGVEIGPVIWGEFAVIFEVLNDPTVPTHGVLYNSPSPTGLGYY